MLDTDEPVMVSFTAMDRCDRCMSQAYAQADKPGKAELLFCLHHLKKHKDALLDKGWTLRMDEENTAKLFVRPGASL